MAFDVFCIVFLGDVFGNVGVTFWFHFKPSWPPKYTLLGHMQGQARTEKRGGCSNASKGRYGFRNVLAFILLPFLHLLFEVFDSASASNF